MSTMAVTSNGDTPPPAVPFSYAQAAKQKAIPQANSTQAQRPSSASSSQQKDTTSHLPAASTPESKSSWAEEPTDAATTSEDTEQRRVSSESGKKASDTSQPMSVDNPKSDDFQTSTPDVSINSSLTTAKDDENTVSPRRSSEAAWDDRPRDATRAKEADISTERSSSRGKSSERSESKAPTKQLKEAPPPMVNIWAQRAQDAKAKQGVGQNQPKPAGVKPEPQATLSSESRQGSKDMGAKADTAKPEDRSSMGQKGDRPASRSVPSDRSQKEWPSTADGSTANPPKPGQPKQHKPGTRQESSPPQPALPAVRDAVSWPTPVSAQDDDRRRSLGKGEKAEGDRSSSAPSKHGKNEWVAMSFTPTVKFNTPLPGPGKRGGRGGARGGRESTGRGGTVSTPANDRHTASHASSGLSEVAPDPSSRSRGDPASTKSSSLPPKSRRPPNDEQGTEPEQPEAIDVSQTKRISIPVDKLAGQATSKPSHHTEDAKIATEAETASLIAESSSDVAKPTTTATEGNGTLFALRGKPVAPVAEIPPFRQKRRTPPNEVSTDPKVRDNADMKRQGPEVGTGKSQSGDKKSETQNPSTDRFGEGAGLPLRERGDGRPDRGRGGRNRPNGGHFPNSHSTNPQPFANGHLPQIQTSHPYHPKNGPSIQSAFPSYPGQYPNSSRNVRTGPKSASIPNEGNFHRYPGSFSGPVAYPGSASLMNGFYDFPATMGGIAYPPYFDQMILVNTVAHQMSYYFSFDNLIKDMFLRRHMDSQGFVDLSLIANFKRMKDLTTDVDLIKYVSTSSSDFELRIGADGKDKLRKRDDWERWVLNLEDRDPSAQNDGPTQSEASQPTWAPGFDQTSMGRSPMSPTEMAAQPHEGIPSPFHGMMRQPFAPPPIASPGGGISGSSTRPNRYSLPAIESDLYHPAQGFDTAQNRSQDDPNEEADSFPNEQIDSLTVVVQEYAGSQARPTPPSFASRTFSNGSIDARSLPDDARRNDDTVERASPRTNGTQDGGRANNLTLSNRRMASRSPSGRPPPDTSVGTFWIKDKGEAPVPLPDGSTYEPYNHLRMKAFQQRQHARAGHSPYDMDVLYKFWSHFLIRNFNTNMYNEFRQLALEDYQNNSNETGMDMLIQYYSESLASQQTIRDRVARHYVELVKAEDPSKDRPAFKKLRMAWRDGALNFKNRIKIRDEVDQELRDALDR